MVTSPRLESQAAVLRALSEPSLLVTGDGEICAVNPAFLRVVNLPAAAVMAHTLPDLVRAPENLRAYLANCARSNRPVPGKLTFASPDGERSFRCAGAVVEPWSEQAPALILLRLGAEESAVSRFVLLNRTIDELNKEVRERRHVEATLRLLAEVSTTLAATLEHRQMLQRLVEQLVGHFADWCIVYLVEPGLGIARVATAHVNPAKQAWAQRLAERTQRYAVPSPFVRVIETGEPLFIPNYVEGEVLHGLDDAEQLAIIRRIDPRSIMAAPLLARQQTLGALVLVWSETDARYDAADFAFANELAKRTALVVENARLYQEARAAEAQLREFNQTLEAQVAERTAELERSNAELDQFAYVASHDLRAPLRAIKHLTDWLEDDAGEALPAKARGHIPKMRQRLARMERLLDDLLTYARAGRQHHPPEEVDCGALVRSVVELLGPPAGFTVMLDAELPSLLTERVPLETVFRNLLNNAIKHHHAPHAGRVQVTAARQDGRVEFAVTDDGPGIAPQYHARIFEIFQSLRPRDQVEGSGMGLAVVKKIVENRGGTIGVRSAVGAGATFWFTWPAA